MTLKLKASLFIASIACLPTISHSAFVFSNVSYTANSLTFTIDGDMTGYDTPVQGDLNVFSIRYPNGMINNSPQNTSWLPDVFDNKTLSDNGITSDFLSSIPYSTSGYSSSIIDAEANMNTVTLTLATNAFNSEFSVSDITFWWGNGHSISSPIFLGTASPVPVPTAIWLMGSGLLGLIGFRNNKHRSSM